jgi:hypothetical protein
MFALMVVLTGNTFALSVSDLQGTWRIVSFSTPSQLSLQKNGLNQVIGIPERQHFDYGTGQVTFDAAGNIVSGTFSEGGETPEAVTGTAAITGQGKVTITVTGDDEGPTIAFLNASKDFMISTKTVSGFNDYMFLLKEAGSVTGAELAGSWSGFGFEVPDQIELIGSPATGINGGTKFSTFPASLAVDGNGAFTGSLDGNFTGNFVSFNAGNLVLSIDPDDEAPFPVTFFINASKNIMIQVMHHDDFSSIELIVFMKKPAAAQASDSVGHWRIGYLGVPNILTPVLNSGFMTELNGRNSFDAAAHHLTSGTDGFLTAVFDEGPTTGAVDLDSITPSGALNLAFGGHEGDEFTFQMNAAADVLFTLNADSFNQEFIFLVKTPVPNGNQEETGLITRKTASTLDFFWATHPDRVLEESTDLITWTVVPSTAGTHQYTPVLSGNKFYRIAREK